MGVFLYIGISEHQSSARVAALLNTEELGKVMQTHGFNPSEEDLKDMIRNVDKNANGAIDFNEFIEMMIKQGTNADEDTAHAFKVFDRDGDGLITAEELMLTGMAGLIFKSSRA